MSIKQSHRSSSGSLGGLGSGSSTVTRVSTVRSGGTCRSPSIHGGHGGRTSYGVGGFGSSGSVSLGLGGAGGFGSGFGYGGGSAGGFGSGSEFGFGGGHFGVHSGVGGKETMQMLNDRLASYLAKVHNLENENSQLEKNIHEWYNKQQPYTSPDYQSYFRTIQELNAKIMQGCTGNASIILQIDNARLAADDFRSKFEIEQATRLGVEADINGIRRMLDELVLTNKDLQMQCDTLNEELQYLKKNHEEEVNSLRHQLGIKVNVEVDAAPSIDINKAISEIRAQYEQIITKNEKEAEQWYIQKSDDLNQQVTSSSQQIQTYSTEILQLNHTVQNLEIDLQTQTSMKAALENTLAETEGRFCAQLSQLQNMISDTEGRISELRCDMERQNMEYNTLMDVKTNLEREIMTYRQLLDGQGNLNQSWYSRGGSSTGGSGSGTSGGISGSGGSGGVGGVSYSGSGKTRVMVEDVHQSK